MLLSYFLICSFESDDVHEYWSVFSYLIQKFMEALSAKGKSLSKEFLARTATTDARMLIIIENVIHVATEAMIDVVVRMVSTEWRIPRIIQKTR